MWGLWQNFYGALVFGDPAEGQLNLISFLVSLFYTKSSYRNSLKMRRWLNFGAKLSRKQFFKDTIRISGFKVANEKVEKRLGVRFGSWNVGSISGGGTEVCEKLRKRKVDVCRLQEVRWRGEGARFIGVKGRRYKLWWCGNDDETGGVGIVVNP